MQQHILGLVNPIIAMLFATVFLILWLRERGPVHVLAFAVSYALLATGFTTFHFSPSPDSAVSILAVHVIYSGAVVALCWGVCRRAGATMRIMPAMAICGVTAAIVLATSFAPDQSSRIYASNTCYGILFSLAAQVLSRSGRREAIDRLILWLCALTAFQFFTRPYAVLVLEDSMSGADYRDSVYYSLTVLSVAVISLMMAMALVAAAVGERIEALRAEGNKDTLTGLLGRRAFEQQAVALLDAAQLEEFPVCAIVADIDHFKRVNDIWGHQTGDCAIAGFGRLLAGAVRADDPVGRIGGEEFCILVRDCERDAAARLAERIRESFTALEIDGLSPDLHLTASFGVAQWRVGEGYGKLFARADSALYAAKDLGRNRVELGTEAASVATVLRAPDDAGTRDVA